MRGRGKLATRPHVHVGNTRLAGRQDSTSVLARNTDHLGPRINAAQHIAQRLHFQVLGAGAVKRVGGVADVAGRGVAGTVFGLPGQGVEPVVANDAGAAGVGAVDSAVDMPARLRAR